MSDRNEIKAALVGLSEDEIFDLVFDVIHSKMAGRHKDEEIDALVSGFTGRLDRKLSPRELGQACYYLEEFCFPKAERKAIEEEAARRGLTFPR